MDLPATVGDKLILAMFVAPLVVCAAFDLWKFRIPNVITGGMLALFPVAGLLAGQPVDWLWHLAAGIVVFVPVLILFNFNIVGGGDAKLLTVAALWLGWDLLLPFTVLTGFFGGVLALLILIIRNPALEALFALAGAGRPQILSKEAGIPYGIAIAVAGCWLAPQLPLVAGP